MTSTMSAVQLFIVAIVAVAGMATWLTLVFLADRQPAARHPSPGETGSMTAGGLGSTEPREPPVIPSPRRPVDARGPEAVPAGADHAGEGEKVPHAAGSSAR